MAQVPNWSTERLREAFAEFSSEFSGTSISSKLRELLILHTAWRAQAECLWSEHLTAAMSVGITHLQIAAIQQGQIGAYVFSPKEKSVLRFQARWKEFASIGDEDVEDLKAHCAEREIADILAVDSLYHMIAMLDVLFWSCHEPGVGD